MKLSEIKGDDAIDIVAEMIDPVTEILADEEIVSAYQAGKPDLLVIKMVLKNHKKAIKTILALLNGENPETYEPNILVLPFMIKDLLSDEEFMSLFHSQGQKMGDASFGSAMETTKETEEM
jgi:hypothetical protein